MDSSGENISKMEGFVVKPTLIIFAYSLWLGLRGNSWLWVITAIVAAISVRVYLMWYFEYGKPKTISRMMPFLLLQYTAWWLPTLIALRLAFYSGIWGFIQSIMHFNLLNLVFAIISIYFGRELLIFSDKLYNITK